jgi:hypothetical protein
MKNVKNVLSVRLDEKTMDRLRERALDEGKEVSAVARELIEEGWVLAAMREYREGKLSLGMMAATLGLSISEALDTLAELGVRSPLEYEDYIESVQAARALLVRDGWEPKRPVRKRRSGPKRVRRSAK